MTDKKTGTPVEKAQEKPKDQTQPVEKAQEKKPEPKPEEKTDNTVNVAKYEEFIGLKFLSIQGGELQPDTVKRLNTLEKELKTMEGRKPIRTVNAAIGNELVKLVQDIPVPEKVEQIIKDGGEKAYTYYFGE